MQDEEENKKVESLLYSKFMGNAATRYGNMQEDIARQKYVAYQIEHGHPNLSTIKTGLTISQQYNWIAASPDDRVKDPSVALPNGLAEYKNPYTAKDLTISEACGRSGFCLEKCKMKEGPAYRLKTTHNYHYQIQCQMFCDQREWCDFIVNTEKDLHVERIYFDNAWWCEQIPKLQTFYFQAILPELACPNHRKGGIREPPTE